MTFVGPQICYECVCVCGYGGDVYYALWQEHILPEVFILFTVAHVLVRLHCAGDVAMEHTEPRGMVPPSATNGCCGSPVCGTAIDRGRQALARRTLVQDTRADTAGRALSVEVN